LPLKAKLTIDKAAQSIDFRELLPVVFNNNIKLQLTAASSSRLPVSYTYSFEGSKAAAIVTSLGKVTVISTGSIVITAHQSGNENYLPAQSISHVLVIENDEALIESYSINKVNKGALLSSSFFRMNCDEISNQVSVELQVSSGALASTTSNFVINTPKPGIYHQEIVVTSQSGSTIKKYELIIERPFNFEDIVIQKFDNTLLVNNNPQTNGGYRFVGYKWFKNGKLIGTEQAYFVGNKKEDLLDRNALYSIELLTDKGEVLHSCSSTIEYSYSHSIRLYPNPIVKNGVLELALDYPDSSLEDAVATVYSITGQFLFKIPIEGSISKIVLPNTISEGVYFVIVKINGKNQPLKFIVKP
ncbi:T9SS type A sorting domain-containing protein, partial [Myroides sp. LJL119]